MHEQVEKKRHTAADGTADLAAVADDVAILSQLELAPVPPTTPASDSRLRHAAQLRTSHLNS